MLKRLRIRSRADADQENVGSEDQLEQETDSSDNLSTDDLSDLNEFEIDDEADEDSDEEGEDGESEEEDSDEDEGVTKWLDDDSVAFLVSVGVHVLLLVALASVTIATQPKFLAMLINSQPVAEELAPLDIVNDIAYSDTPNEEIGADSVGSVDMALSSAPTIADVSAVNSVDLDVKIPEGDANVKLSVEKAVGLTESPKVVRGMTGVGSTGTDGAVDRVTYEILQSLEERPTLVVWIFDSSISMVKRRQEIRDRFDSIYQQLGIVQEQKEKREGTPEIPPLLTAIMEFGNEVKVLTKDPTDSIEQIRGAIDSIGNEGGDEMVFHAVKAAVNRYKSFRGKGGNIDRNVMLIVITDERGDDLELAEETIKTCRHQAMPCYVLGVPAPFGRDKTFIKFVEFDPAYAQVEDWAEVDQGPESLFPERVKLEIGRAHV